MDLAQRTLRELESRLAADAGWNAIAPRVPGDVRCTANEPVDLKPVTGLLRPPSHRTDPFARGEGTGIKFVLDIPGRNTDVLIKQFSSRERALKAPAMVLMCDFFGIPTPTVVPVLIRGVINGNAQVRVRDARSWGDLEPAQRAALLANREFGRAWSDVESLQFLMASRDATNTDTRLVTSGGQLIAVDGDYSFESAVRAEHDGWDLKLPDVQVTERFHKRLHDLKAQWPETCDRLLAYTDVASLIAFRTRLEAMTARIDARVQTKGLQAYVGHETPQREVSRGPLGL